jgi:hypothetical protein
LPLKRQRAHSRSLRTSCLASHLRSLRTVAKEVLVERFSFASDVAFVPRGDLLDRVTIAPLTSPFEAGALVQAAIFGSRQADDFFGIQRLSRTSSPSWTDQEK